VCARRRQSVGRERSWIRPFDAAEHRRRGFVRSNDADPAREERAADCADSEAAAESKWSDVAVARAVNAPKLTEALAPAASRSIRDNHAAVSAPAATPPVVVEATDHDALGRGMKAIGARIARAVNRIAHRSGRVLADRYHLRLLPTPREVRGALRYVLLNARRHAAKAGAALRRGRDVLDPASSARWFDGWKRSRASAHDGHRILPPESRKCPVARPRTWLLRIGWRRHGLLDPADVPGGGPSRLSPSS